MAMKNKYLRKLINDFEAFVRLHEMKGSYHPDERYEIEQQFVSAKRKLLKYLEEREGCYEQLKDLF